MTEQQVHQNICDYLRLQYPDLMFRTDFAAGSKMTPGQAAKHKRLNPWRGWPDLFIAEPYEYYSDEGQVVTACGLFIELKKLGTKLYRKDGQFVSNPHIQEQAKVLQALRDRGYGAEFAVGFDEAKELIDRCYGHLKNKGVHDGGF